MGLKDDYSVIKVVEQYARRVRFHYNGRDVSKQDKNLLIFAFTSQYCIGIDLGLESTSLYRTFVPFLCRKEIDIIKFGNFLKVVDGVIKNYSEYDLGDSYWTYMRFKHACSACEVYWDFIAPIRNVIIDYLQTPVAHLFRIINQWLNFVQRCNLKSLDLADSLVEKYVVAEREYSCYAYDYTTLTSLAAIISEWTESFTFDGFLPQHGPGSIAGRKGRPCIAEKYCDMGADMRLQFLQKYIGALSSYSPVPFRTLSRVSDLVFVPKSLITQRTISKEPSSLQYFQQGVSNCLLKSLENSEASCHIDLKHQEYSRTLALKGSINGDYATIDLSDASDSVTVSLVKYLFRNSLVRNALLCCRSDYTRIEHTGETLKLAKFAPMGASTCFPVETLIFAACCELAVTRTMGRKRYYRVYGDDIIIHHSCVPELLLILEACHFKVNDGKSFTKMTKHNFREACGGEYFDGIDVAPLRIPRKLAYYEKVKWHQGEKFERYISLANKAYEFGFSTFRRYIFSELKRMNIQMYTQTPYSEDGCVGLQTYGDCCTNFRLPSRFNEKLYRKEFRYLVSVTRKDDIKIRRLHRCHLDETIALFEWLRQAQRPESKTKFFFRSCRVVSILPTRAQKRAKWAAV